MKVIIDLIEDVRSAINNDTSFTLSGMALKENDQGEHEPLWQSNIVHYRLDETAKKLFLFLGKEDPVTVETLLNDLNTYSNEAMMYELNITYTQDDSRKDKSLIGFGEALEEKKYLLFISDK